MRSYTQLIDRLKVLAATDLDTIASVGQYPIYHLSLQGSTSSRCRVLLTAGVHGDEPGGVEAVLHLLENGRALDLTSFDFTIVPCVNPHGYVHDARENAAGDDINRSFERDDVAEVALVKDLLRDRPIDCFVDFHEDWEAKGFISL